MSFERVQAAARALIVIMGALTLAVIVIALTRVSSDGTPVDYATLILYGLVTLIATIIPVRFRTTELSGAHVFGITAFLAMPVSQFPALTVTIAVVTFLGTFIHRYLWERKAPRWTSIWAHVIALTSGMTLGFFASGSFFLEAGGEVPIGVLPNANLDVMMLFIFYVSIYMMIYVLGFLLERLLTQRNRQDLMRDLPSIIAVMVLPAPIGVLGGQIASSFALTTFIIFVYGALFGLLALNGLSRAEQRLREDLGVHRSMVNQNEQLVAEQTAQISHLALLNQVVATLSGTLSPDTLIDHIISCASVLTDATGFTIYLNWNERFELARSIGLQGNQTLSVSVPLLLQAAAVNNSDEYPVLVISDLERDSRAERLRKGEMHRHFTSLIELPLLANGELLGMIGLYYPHQIGTADSALELLRTFTTQAAQALYNARQYVMANDAFQRNAERLTTLAVLSRSLSTSVDVDTMCDQVLDEVMLATGADAGMLVLLDDFASTPQIGAVRSIPNEKEQFGEVVTALRRIDPASGAYVIRRETYTVGLPPFLTVEAQSMLIVPMVQSSFLFGAIWLESASVGVFDPDDIGFVEQISNQAVIALENARLFQRIEGDRERLSSLLDTMVEGIMMVDHQGDIVLANPRMGIVGLQPELLVNTNFLALVGDESLRFSERMGFQTPDEATSFVLNMESYLESAESKSYAVEGESGVVRQVERKIVPVASAGDTLGLLLVFYDRTEQRELERSREELTSMIVHDLRSPLTAINTSLRLLQDMIPQDIPSRRAVEATTDVSRRAVKKILNRVNSLLDIAKLQSGQLALNRDRVAFKQLIDTVIEELTPLAMEMRIALKVNGSGESPVLNVDTDKTERVLLNFVDNALKYSPENTLVTIKHYAPETNGAAPGFVRIDVTDQGPGIPPEYRSKLFKSFVQVEGRRSTRGGVGLGLTFAKLTVEAHGGRIWIEDNPGGGSIFAFTLPLANTSVN